MTTSLVTGPTRGLGRSAALAMAARGEDLLLLGRPGKDLTEVAAAARALGVHAHEIGCDLADLASVRAAAAEARRRLNGGRLRSLVANAGLMSPDTRRASADGYELTFAVNYLAHAQLISDLQDTLAPSARIVLIGSNTYHANFWRRLLHVPPADWRDPVEIARPTPAGADHPGLTASGTAYSTAKLAILYYAHELQRRVPDGVTVAVYEPGWMPGTALSRGAPPAAQSVGRALARIPGVATPERSGPQLAAVALDRRWAHLRDGAFVVRDNAAAVRPEALDPARERRLWEATTELLAPHSGT